MRYLFRLSPWNGQRQFEKPVWIYPAHLAMYATYLRNKGEQVVWNPQSWSNDDNVIEDDSQITIPYEQLPIPDRIFTNSMDPRYTSYGNYRYRPGTHYLSSQLCWWAGKKGCTFCVDSKRIIEGETRGVRTVEHVISEIEDCVRVGHKEAFDDAGTIPINKWLNEFCEAMIKTGLNKKIHLGCNLKPIKQDFKLMKEAGFKFILVGVESANQKTIDRIQKGQRVDKVIENIKAMSDAGLAPHITGMCAYPWETWEEEKRTIDLYHYLLRKGYAKTAQVSIYSPPRTRPEPNSVGHKRVPLYFSAYTSPEFWYNKIKDIRDLQDVEYLFRGATLVAQEYWRKYVKR